MGLVKTTGEAVGVPAQNPVTDTVYVPVVFLEPGKI